MLARVPGTAISPTNISEILRGFCANRHNPPEPMFCTWPSTRRDAPAAFSTRGKVDPCSRIGFSRLKRGVVRRSGAVGLLIMVSSIRRAPRPGYHPNGLDHMVNCLHLPQRRIVPIVERDAADRGLGRMPTGFRAPAAVTADTLQRIWRGIEPGNTKTAMGTSRRARDCDEEFYALRFHPRHGSRRWVSRHNRPGK